MAIATDLNLINQVQISANKLGVASKWADTSQPVSVADDFLFEMYVLFELILSLQQNYIVTYLPGSQEQAHKFPQKPANKNGRPRFEIHHPTDGLICQVCAGTTVADIHGVERAPDISFQTDVSPDNPDFNHLLLIWDAKYRKDPNARITHPEVSEFGRWLEVFKLRGAPAPSINLAKLSKLAANCLITNGNASTEPALECERLWMKEVANFHPKSMFSVKP